MKISKFELVQSGLKGMIVHYLENENREGFEFLNEHKTTYKAPVPAMARTLIQRGTEYFIDLARLDSALPKGAVRLVKVEGNDEKIRFSGNVVDVDGCEFPVVSPWIEESTIYSKWNKLQLWHEECLRLVEDYSQKGQIEDAKQFMIDFSQTEKGNKDFGDLDFDKMAEGELRDKMREALEKSGAIIIDSGDYSDKPKMAVAN